MFVNPNITLKMVPKKPLYLTKGPLLDRRPAVSSTTLLLTHLLSLIQQKIVEGPAIKPGFRT
jgi:hypothetical protein